MEILVVIPARGGSKGLPGKNIKKLHGKPLIYYSIDVARELFSDPDICVSTDDLEIKACVEDYSLNVPFLRPEYLASDQAGTYEVLLHALSFYESIGKQYDYILLLQPTSPFRKKIHIEEVIRIAIENPESEMIVSVREAKDNPYFNLFEENEVGFLAKSKPSNFSRRQDCPTVYAFNGSIYLIKSEALKIKNIVEFEHLKKYLMPDNYSMDIDTIQDWEYASYILSKDAKECS